MKTSSPWTYIFLTCTFLLTVISAVDGGTSLKYFDGIEKASLNRQVKQYVKSYLKQNKKNLYSIKQRSSSPFAMIDSVFKSYHLPVQLKYLAVVESELKPKAVSKVGAAGPWQLMPATARILGLKISARDDERKNYFKSTRAAARFLKDLHQEFGDWLLVFAAYNGGDRPVFKAMRQSGSKNYWTMQRYLPEETRDYVKKFIATCYYFEGSCSPTLLSKSDAPYANLSPSFPDLQAIQSATKELAQNGNETSEEKFNRILKASEESLQRSNRILKNIK
jgi:membrane-bound lytic murein transglycosylase D